MSKSLSTFCAASLENVSSVSGLHSLSEAVLFLSLALLRLISSKHLSYLLVSLYIIFLVSAWVCKHISYRQNADILAFTQ